MNVLIIDDDKLYQQLIAKALKSRGYRTTVVDDGNQGLKKFTTDNYDLVITDILMPNKEGIEVIQEIRDKNSALKILAVSGGGRAGFSSFLQIAKTFGADESLEKPFTPAQLLQKVETLLTGTV